MDVILTIICGVLVLSFLVVIHEAGHYGVARAFGVRVTEFMIGMPGPNIGFKIGETKFGITPILLGGYARVCGMETGPISPYLKDAMILLFRRGSITPDELADELYIDDVQDAFDVLDELVEWGCAVSPKKHNSNDAYLSQEVRYSKKQLAKDGIMGLQTLRPYAAGEPRDIPAGQEQVFFDREFKRQYRSLPFWKRCLIVAAGPVVNLLFAILAIVFIYSVIGFDYTYTATGETFHVHASVLNSIQAGFLYIGMVVQAVINLFNPATVAQTISDSTSVVGIAVISKQAADAGLISLLEFCAMISVSLGIMNLVPIMPLDGGRIIIEIVQKIARRDLSMKLVNVLSLVGMALFLLLFVVMVNQDVSRFILGNW